MHPRTVRRSLEPLPLLLAPLLLGVALAACSGGECPAGEVHVDGACIPGECVPGTTECEGGLVRACLDDASAFGGATACGSGEVCSGDACVPRSQCQNADPACCATVSDCGPTTARMTCNECRAVAETGYCTAGSCEPVPGTLVPFKVAADAAQMAPADAAAVSSVVLTFYAPIGSDGRAVTCDRILAPQGDGPSMHDAFDATLNPLVSVVASVAFSTGNDVYAVRVPNVPVVGDEVIVATAYDFPNGEGQRTARGCLEGVTPTAEGGTEVALRQ